jgi:mono/diheme cytochrome c family protein
LIAIVGCASALSRPTPADVQRAASRWPDVSLSELQHGREVYVARCASCHPLYLPREEPAARWGAVLDGMAPRAGISADERKTVERSWMTMATAER